MSPGMFGLGILLISACYGSILFQLGDVCKSACRNFSLHHRLPWQDLAWFQLGAAIERLLHTTPLLLVATPERRLPINGFSSLSTNLSAS
jgi:hypothetical protein